MALLKAKKVMWVKLGQPEESWDKSFTQWSLIALVDKEFQKKWIKKGLPGGTAKNLPREIELDGVTSAAIKLNRKTHYKKSGDEMKPVKVVDMFGQDVDPRIIGNGTTMNIQYKSNEYDFNGKQGFSAELIAVQVIDLVEYKGGDSGTAGDEFEFMAKEEVPFKDDLDLDDDVFE